jgi:hypothetical protein
MVLILKYCYIFVSTLSVLNFVGYFIISKYIASR